MQTIKLQITNKVGLHARPASVFVQTCNKFKSKITAQNLTTGSKPANAKSILGVLTLGVEKDHLLALTAEGEDEAQALEALKALAENRFGEPD